MPISSLRMSEAKADEMLENLRSILKEIPEFVAYDTIFRARYGAPGKGTTSSSRPKPSSAANSNAGKKSAAFTPPRRSDTKTTPEEKEAIIRGCMAYFKKSKNAEITCRHLAHILVNQGIAIQGNPGTTLGAILLKHPGFEHANKKEGLWHMTPNAYAEMMKRPTMS
jgi:hypothetical protein